MYHLENEIAQDKQLPCEGTMGPRNLCVRLVTGCYCIVGQQFPWRQAFDYCRSFGKFLLSVNAVEKQRELQAQLPLIIPADTILAQVGVWTSGTFALPIHRFVWASTGQPFSPAFSFWHFGSPRNIGPNDCVRLVPFDNSFWDDIDCFQSLPSICETLLRWPFCIDLQ